jgi:hypothetical protein
MRLNAYFCFMAYNYRKPTNHYSEPISFSIESEGQTYSGTLTPSGKPPAFGMPNAFAVRIPGIPTMNISIYMGRWVMPAREDLVFALSDWINNYYK